MAKARERVPGEEHHTISVASAGWITAIPAPSTADETIAAAGPDASPRP